MPLIEKIDNSMNLLSNSVNKDKENSGESFSTSATGDSQTNGF